MLQKKSDKELKIGLRWDIRCCAHKSTPLYLKLYI